MRPRGTDFGSVRVRNPEYIAKRLRIDHTAKGSRIEWAGILDTEGTFRKVSPMQYERLAVPDVTPSHAARQVIDAAWVEAGRKLDMRDRVDLNMAIQRNDAHNDGGKFTRLNVGTLLRIAPQARGVFRDSILAMLDIGWPR